MNGLAVFVFDSKQYCVWADSVFGAQQAKLPDGRFVSPGCWSHGTPSDFRLVSENQKPYAEAIVFKTPAQGVQQPAEKQPA